MAIFLCASADPNATPGAIGGDHDGLAVGVDSAALDAAVAPLMAQLNEASRSTLLAVERAGMQPEGTCTAACM